MLADVHECETYQAIVGISGRTVEMERIDDGVASLGGGSHVHDGFEVVCIPRNGGKEPGIFIGVDVDERREAALGVAVDLSRAVLRVEDIDGFSEPVGVSLGGTGEDVNVSRFIESVVAQELAGRAEGESFWSELEVGVRDQVEDNVVFVAERDDGNDLFIPEVAVVSGSVVVAVATKESWMKIDSVIAQDFEEPIESF